MTFEEFRQSLQASDPPAELPLVLAALWWDAKGDWTKAHECAQQRETPDHAWVHAYLHRKEGDLSNARYWYGQAGRPEAKGTFQEEWNAIARELLAVEHS
jgi:hypothetical protein